MSKKSSPGKPGTGTDSTESASAAGKKKSLKQLLQGGDISVRNGWAAPKVMHFTVPNQAGSGEGNNTNTGNSASTSAVKRKT